MGNPLPLRSKIRVVDSKHNRNDACRFPARLESITDEGNYNPPSTQGLQMGVLPL